MALNKYLMGEMTWPELKEAVGEGRIAVMPAGCIEQHGPALPLDTDILLADEISRRAAALVPDKVVLVPSVIHGHSPHHMDFPGTLTAEPIHMIEYVLDLTMSLSHHGFTKILLINGHGSNSPVLDLVARQTILRSNGKTACASINYWALEEYEAVTKELFPEMAGMYGHADEIETSAYMAIRPELVQLEKAEDNPITDAMMLGSAVLPLRLIWSSFSKEGIYGNVKNSSAEKGRKLVEAAVSGIAKIYTQFYEKKIPQAVDHH